MSVLLGFVAMWCGCAGLTAAVVCGLAVGYAIRWIAEAVRWVAEAVAQVLNVFANFLGFQAAADRNRAKARASAWKSYELRALVRRLDSLNIIDIGLAPKIIPSPVSI